MEKLKGALVVGFLRLFALLPWCAVQAVGNAIGWLMWKLPNGSRDVVRINLSKCFPELNQAELDKLCRAKPQGHRQDPDRKCLRLDLAGAEIAQAGA